ncbi:hypothetical protein PoB_003030300 [Plakobranchus ocellatus]|uniref:Uncharacterized protein n=1 Tax=Plakobranchus ocellatus TaxID=259542 RepID=A0AAV4AAM0_9GAST|nr:hypothetical protein PoB_003030300 [Plakobranchus ocellatus]
MANSLETSLRVSLHASEDLRRSLTSDTSLSSSMRLGHSSYKEGQGLHGSRSGGVSLWGSPNTWPRSLRSTSSTINSVYFCSSTSSSRFRSSRYSMTSSCLLHAHGDSPGVCPFDGSKYRLKPLPRLSPLGSPASSVYGERRADRESFSGILGSSESTFRHPSPLRTESDEGIDNVMKELDEVFQGSMSARSYKAPTSYHFNGRPAAEIEVDRSSRLNTSDTMLNADLRALNRTSVSHRYADTNYRAAEESLLLNTTREIHDESSHYCAYGNLSSSSRKFPSRISLQSAGSNELDTSGRADNSKAVAYGRKICMEIEAKYEQYKETCE